MCSFALTYITPLLILQFTDASSFTSNDTIPSICFSNDWKTFKLVSGDVDMDWTHVLFGEAGSVCEREKARARERNIKWIVRKG